MTGTPSGMALLAPVWCLGLEVAAKSWWCDRSSHTTLETTAFQTGL